MLKFAKEGVLEKEIYKNNEYRSVYLIGLTKSTYIENSSKYIMNVSEAVLKRISTRAFLNKEVDSIC